MIQGEGVFGSGLRKRSAEWFNLRMEISSMAVYLVKFGQLDGRNIPVEGVPHASSGDVLA